MDPSNISGLAAIDFPIFLFGLGIGTCCAIALAGAGVAEGLVGWMRVVLCLRSGDVGIRTVGGVGVYREGEEDPKEGVGVDLGIANCAVDRGEGCWIGIIGISGGDPAIAGLMAYVCCQRA